MDHPGQEKNSSSLNQKPRISDKVVQDTVSLDLAMQKEDYSIKLYEALLGFCERGDSKRLLGLLIEEEKVHFNLLREVLLTGNYERLGIAPVEGSLELTDYLIKDEIHRSSGPEEIVKMAIRREEEAEEFYLSRVNFVQEEKLKNLYQRLAREEAVHREKLLKSYDDLVIMNFT